MMRKAHGTWRGWLAWAAILLLLGLLAAWRLDTSDPLRTNILELLPQRDHADLVDQAIADGQQAFNRELLVVIRDADAVQARRGAREAHAALLQNGLQAAPDTSETLHAMLALYQQHHQALLTPHQMQRLQQAGVSALANDMAAGLSGMSDVRSDPGGYLARRLAQLPRPYADFRTEGPFLTAKKADETLYLLRLRLHATAFSEAGMHTADIALQAAGDALAQACATCRMDAAGAVLFSQAASRQAKAESMWFSLASTLFIMLLIAYVFHTIAPHLLGFLQLFSTIFAAAASVVIVFGHINVLTLVFGTTLLGIVIDYAFLYFAQYWFGDEPPDAVGRVVAPGIVVGLTTAVIAFVFMLLTGFPALTQIAVFSIGGLIEAYLVVLLVFPAVLKRAVTRRTPRFARWPARMVERIRTAGAMRHVAVLLLLLLAAPGWLHLEASDDVRELSHFPESLLQTETRVRDMLGETPPDGFYLVQGDDLAAALEHERVLIRHLDALMPQATVFGLSQFLPAATEQQQSLAIWRDLLADESALQKALTDLGLPITLADYLQQSTAGRAAQPLQLDQLLAVAPDLAHFIITGTHAVGTVVSVSGRADALAAVPAAIHDMAHVTYVQPVQEINRMFSKIRIRAVWLVLAGYALIALFLWWRYGFREAMRMLYPGIIALGVTLGVMGWLGYTLNVFVVVALILILGLGRDYTIFLRESGFRNQAVALAVTLSALTTMGSFGLLALSRIPALHTFGVATLLGILVSFVAAPLSLPRDTIEEKR